MAPKSASVKGFYRQKKNTKFIASKNASTKKSPTHDLLELKDSCNEDEEVLMQFDMNMAYGPCLGMSRRARWERAVFVGGTCLGIPSTILGSSNCLKFDHDRRKLLAL
ncbi:hypothetical protein SAY87_009094 [Trapa incisa]|uniref:DNA polymerase delta subunit 4 n=1 Tax=Trapa incisa TaxID=236973 RepID=A0AAN7JY73_9MYRT|nr:hypothetical protein SAY87_009094 [Trapa incisa]